MSDDVANDILERKRALAQMLNGQRSASSRKKTQRRLADAVDGRALNATGRTDQLNFRCSSELKDEVKRLAREAGVPIAVFMENAVLAYIDALKKEST